MHVVRLEVRDRIGKADGCEVLMEESGVEVEWKKRRIEDRVEMGGVGDGRMDGVGVGEGE